MIEIVRNAVTIAAIQRSVGGTTGAFRNDALHEWLRSKGPPEGMVRSCDAGEPFGPISGFLTR